MFYEIHKQLRIDSKTKRLELRAQPPLRTLKYHESFTARGFKTRSAGAGSSAVIRVLIFLTTSLSLWLIRVLAPEVFSTGFSGFPPPLRIKKHSEFPFDL